MAQNDPNRFSQAETTSPPADMRHHLDFDSSVNPVDGVTQLMQSLGINETNNASGVTIKPAPHQANAVKLSKKPKRSAEDVLNEVQQDDTRGQLIQSSFKNGADTSFVSTSNGFVNSTIQAYNQHRHLKIRPEDIWLSILTQLSSYINAHAEELRGSFVAHEGKKELVIEYTDGSTRFTLDWSDFAYKIGVMIQDNVVDPELREWIMPAFSTTTSHDVVVASIVMMASMQKYFSYTCMMTCGLPSVTLLGEKADYQFMLQRLEKLRSYGEEPTLFADLLTPILKRMILSFEEPESKEVVDFWNRIFSSYNMGSGSDDYNGWITAFMFWDTDGKMLYRRKEWLDKDLPPLTLDGVTYPTISEDDVPPGFCTVPVKIDEYGHIIEAEMLAGSVGWDWDSSGGAVANSEQGSMDTIQARSGWWIYEKLPEEEVEAKRKAEREKHEAELEGLRRQMRSNR